jgi:hypothetical protein
MIISNEPLVPNTPVKFTVKGFPEEEGLRSSIERFYAIKTDANRNFSVYNSFEEQIFSGVVNESGKIENLLPIGRPGKSYSTDAKPKV